MGKCAEFVHGTAELGNYRAGERQSWLRGFVFVRGPEPIYGTTGSSGPAFTGTQAWEAPLSGTHAWDKVILVRNRAPFCRDCRCFSGLGVRTMSWAAMS